MLELKKIKPLFTKILVTANKYEEVQYIEGTQIVDTEKKQLGLKEYQTVIAVGNEVTTVKPGDLVIINPTDYMVKKYSKDSTKSQMDDVYNPIIEFNFNIVIVDGKECLLLKERDVDFIAEEYIEVDETIQNLN